MSSGGDSDRHREHLGVSQTKHAKKKKSRRLIDPEDIAGSISFAPERISHDTYLFDVPFGTTDPRQYYPNYRRLVGASSTSHALPPRRYEDLPLQAIHRARPLSAGTPSPTGISPQLSAMRLGDSSSEQSNAMAGTPPLTQRVVHPDVSPSSTATPSATPHDTMSTLAPGQKNRLGRVMIEPDGSSWHPAKNAARALKECVRRLYTQAHHSWTEIPNSIRQMMFNNFKTMCTWESRYNLVIGTTFERKASTRLSSWLMKVRDSGERPGWMLSHVFDELGKRIGTHSIEPEVFKKTHVRKKENESDPDVWVEETAERTFSDFHQYVAENLDSSVQLTPELSTQIWKEKVVGGTHKGIGSSRQAEALDGVQIAVMSDQIAKLTVALAESERRRVTEQQSMSGQLKLSAAGIRNIAEKATDSVV
ncbi:hypothetical protein MTR67_052863 [Solanum verrucosum]|uniref:Uncharacterized protein n=1 Tax=Solanum verrucosum TaxID=315347 RepID=A0AAF1A374_SOLVR|nr:hypothetical protein MTR67_052863 [Solanum verrucosum]